MTQFQQSASVRTLDTSERAYPAPFLAIVAGLIASINQHRLESAQRIADQWAAAALVSRSQSLKDGWEAAQIRHGQSMRDFVKRIATPD